ncbi:MAG: hypothetical protein ACM3ZU_00295 [Bacteroidota bacterium]
MRAVITEVELKKLAAASSIILPRGAIVTPAARDYAREHGVTLVEATEAGTTAFAEVRPHRSVEAAIGFARGGGAPSYVAGATLEGTESTSSASVGPGRSQAAIQVDQLMVKIARAAATNLRPHVEREVLIRVIAAVLARLGYAVVVSAVTQQD